jgi:hypothetical protein
MKPSIARMVIVPSTSNGATEAPAVITRVWPDTGLINVKVLHDMDGAPEWRTSVVLHDERPEKPGHDAWWPPRV